MDEMNYSKQAKGEKTKYKLAYSMKECMETTSVENITVKQIVENCGLTRQTFYRNFLDKYDLVNLYFDKILTRSFVHMGQGKTVYDAACEKIHLYSGRAVFFCGRHFSYDSQNSLRQHDFDLILAFYENLIYEKTGRHLEADTHFLLEMYCNSSIYMTVRWVLGEISCTPQQLAQILVKGMPQVLEELFTELGILN